MGFLIVVLFGIFLAGLGCSSVGEHGLFDEAPCLAAAACPCKAFVASPPHWLDLSQPLSIDQGLLDLAASPFQGPWVLGQNQSRSHEAISSSSTRRSTSLALCLWTPQLQEAPFLCRLLCRMDYWNSGTTRTQFRFNKFLELSSMGRVVGPWLAGFLAVGPLPTPARMHGPGRALRSHPSRRSHPNTMGKDQARRAREKGVQKALG